LRLFWHDFTDVWYVSNLVVVISYNIKPCAPATTGDPDSSNWQAKVQHSSKMIEGLKKGMSFEKIDLKIKCKGTNRNDHTNCLKKQTHLCCMEDCNSSTFYV
jgi:hypothetical protein